MKVQFFSSALINKNLTGIKVLNQKENILKKINDSAILWSMKNSLE